MTTTRKASAIWNGNLIEGNGSVSMALSSGLAKAGTPPTQLRTSAEVDFVPGTGITEIRLTVSGDVPNLNADGFREAAESAKVNCPVSQVLKAVPIKLVVE